MIALNVHYKDNTPAVMKAVDKGAYKSFKHGAASIRKSIIESIRIEKTTIGWITTNRLTKKGKRIRARIYKPSPVGHPVYSHRNKGFVRRGIKFDADKEGAMIGFAHSVYGDVMRVHEHGGTRKGQRFDKRPTVLPGLTRNINRISSSWRGTISQSF